jgi:hypothetical protein
MLFLKAGIIEHIKLYFYNFVVIKALIVSQNVLYYAAQEKSSDILKMTGVARGGGGDRCNCSGRQNSKRGKLETAK